MGHVTNHKSQAGKDFPRSVRRGKKYRPVLLGLGGCVLFWMMAGGLAIAEQASSGKWATVTFAPEAVVAGSDVCLEDVALIDTDDPELRERLAGIVIGTVPRVGRVLTFRGDGLRLLLRRDRRELGLSDADVDLTGADATRILAESQTIAPDLLLDELRPWVADRASATYGADSVEVEYKTTPRTIDLPVGGWEVLPRLASLPSRVPTVLSLPVAIRVDGRIAATVTLALNLQMHSTVAVAKRSAARHEALGDADVEFVDVDLANLNGSPMARNADDLIGLRTTRDVQVGDPLTDANCELMPLVEKGDQVTVFVEARHIRLSTAGEAQRDGRSGDVIEVRNLRSDRIIRGTVIGKGIVRVVVPQPETAVTHETALAQ